MSNVQKNMTPEEKLEFRKNNPLTVFCKHSYYNFFAMWCRKKCKKCDGNCAKTCSDYCPTVEDK